MKLVIVESPNKCQTIGSFLGKDYEVVASQGHICDLSKHGKGGLGIDVEHGFQPDFVISKDKEKIVQKLKGEAKKADEVILATDPDREGEAIAWHLARVLNLPVDTTKRLAFHEITRPAILAALENPSHINMNLVESQETRRMYDRVIGFKLSTLLQRKIGSPSAGRVQSATLKLIVDNDREIKAFQPKEYWTIDAVVDLGDGKTLTVSLDKVDGRAVDIHSKAEADAIVARIGETMNIVSLTTARKATASKYPFNTSSMQQEAFARYKFPTSKTQSLAQRLYEGLDLNGEHVGLITYMRTDSTRISPEFYEHDAKPYILNKFGPTYLGRIKPTKQTSERIQDAHEAIRPTSATRTPESVAQYLTPDELKLYRLIYDRALASLMTPKVDEVSTALFQTNGLTFRASGSRMLFPGYTALYGEPEDAKEKQLPPLKEGADYAVKKVDPEQKFTAPPARYTEAKVTKLMEEKGIGRPSTYASTIQTLLNRSRAYVTSKGGVLTPTERGVRTTEALEQNFPEIVSTNYTAQMESELDQIEEGKQTRLQAMTSFYYPFMEKFEKVRESMEKTPDEPTGEMCPVCGSPLVYKTGRYGRFVACSNYPKCKYVQKEKPKETGRLCPVCGKPLVYRKDRKGREFVACSGYPSCTYIEGNETQEKNNPTTYTEKDWVKPCPSCHTGHLVVKHGKKADFLGCTNFPKCRYHEWINDKKK